MNSLLLRRLALAALASTTVPAAWALTLGRAQGVALIGRPLDVAIAVTPDAGADDSALCTDADIFYGDSKVDQGRVEVRPPTGANPSVRVRVTAPVNEPVVTIYLRVGCTQKITRRYVLLSEQPGDAAELARAAALPAPDAVMAQPSAAVTPSAAAAGATAPRTGGAAAAARRTPAQPPAAPVAPSTPPQEGAAPAAGAPAAAAGVPPAASSRARRPGPAASKPQPRLRLEPLDLGIERDPTLQLTPLLGAVEEGNTARRAEAAALWRAINQQPEDVLRDAQRLQAVEAEARTLRQGQGRAEASLAEVRGQLARAEQERYANGLVYGLAAALAFSLALAGWLWWRGRRAAQEAAWWEGDDAGGAESSAVPTAMLVSTPAPLAKAPEPPVSNLLDLDLGSDELAPPPPPTAPAVRASGFAASGFGPSGRADLQRALRAEELNDVQQQADFFVSLGEHARAVEVLRGHIEAHPQGSAVAWLDLLEIHHKLGDEPAYEEVRRDFEWLFNARVPAFAEYRVESPGLEGYPLALTRIQALWPEPRVLEVIEESIFRRPGGMDGEAFSLEAYRELLLLHALATELCRGAGSDASINTMPLRDTTQPGMLPAAQRAELQTLAVAAMPLRDHDVDINLDELPTLAPEDEPPGAVLQPAASPADGAHLLNFDFDPELARQLKPKPPAH